MASFRMFGTIGFVAALLVGCASTRVDFGGVMNPQPVPADAVACADVEWQSVDRVAPAYPPALVALHMMRQDPSTVRSLVMHYDVDDSGATANIRLFEPQAYTRHATFRKAILASAEAIAQWRFQHTDQPFYATGCATAMDFGYETG
jgi:hypothetical protein